MKQNALSAAELRHFEGLLSARRHELRSQLQAAWETSESEREIRASDAVRDTKDIAFSGQIAEAGAADESRVSEELAAIDIALHRIAAGKYGMCMKCGNPIGVGRLESQPSAIRCRPCQSNSEHSSPVSVESE
jgi:RNA polymerase-binding transcription factor DksA